MRKGSDNILIVSEFPLVAQASSLLVSREACSILGGLSEIVFTKKTIYEECLCREFSLMFCALCVFAVYNYP